MKTKFSIILGIALLLITCCAVNSQCLIVSKGQKVQVKSSGFANTLPTTVKKWEKMSSDQREPLVAQLNQDIESGKVKPWMSLVSNFEIMDTSQEGEISSYRIKATDGAYEYETVNYCARDTMHLVRNANIVYSVYKGDTLGFAVQGIQRIPNNLKVGDALPSYRDYMITIPKTWTSMIKESVKSFSYTTSKNKIGWMQDSYSGKFSYGEFKVTERHDVYSTISHKVKITQNIENVTVHYFVALVTGKEEIKIGSKTYPAFIIESESWSKGGLLVDYDAENERIANEQQLKFEKLMAKSEDFNRKSGMVNELGYGVKYLKEWFVPGYGVVRLEVRDIHGAIQNRMETSF